METPAARAMAFDTRSGRQSWTLVDQSGLPIAAVEEFLSYLRALGKSRNTVEAYARHLSLLWRWLQTKQLSWDLASFTSLSEFLLVYRRGLYPLETRSGAERSESSTRAVAAAVKEFYDFHHVEGDGPKNLDLTRVSRRSRSTQNQFLAHIAGGRGALHNRLVTGLKSPPPLPQIINFEDDFGRLLDACHTARDRLLLSAMYDGGLRIGQVLGLRHGDLVVPRRVVLVERRDYNANGALSKTPDLLELDMPRRFFAFYRDYLLDELTPRGIESDYLIVNLRTAAIGSPCSYSNAYQSVVSIGERAGVKLTPHTLRHTHATALAKAGWTSAEIAARLGQRHAGSADVYIHLASSDLSDRLRDTAHLIWPRNIHAN